MAQALVLKAVTGTRQVAPAAPTPLAPQTQQVAAKNRGHGSHHGGKKHHDDRDSGSDSDHHHHKGDHRRRSRREQREGKKSGGGNGKKNRDGADEDEEDKKKSGKSKYIGDAIDGTVPGSDTIRCHLEDYLEAKIARYMARKGLSRADATRTALLKAHKKKYPVVDGDPGYGYGVALAALGEGEQKERFRLRLGDVVLNSVKCSPISDEELRVGFGISGALRAPSRGPFVLAADYPAAPSQTSGYYDLASRGVLPGSGWHKVRLPLYHSKKIERAAAYSLPQCELDATVEAVSADVVSVRQLELVVRLRPSAAAHLDPRSTIPCHAGRTALPASPYLFGYSQESERASSECTSKPAGLSEAISRIVDNASGTQSAFRFSSHVGRQPVCQAGRHADSDKEFYRLGHVTEQLTIVALCAHVQECAPEHFGHEVNMHDPALTEFLLERSGAVAVLSGLRKAFACVGREGANLPSPFDLMNHFSGLPDHLDAGVDIITEMLASASQQADGDPSCDSHMEEVEREFGTKLAEVRVLSAPGAIYGHSHLGFAVLRFMLPDWKHSAHACEAVLKCCGELGMPTLNYTGCHQFQKASCHAPSCTSSAETCASMRHDEPESPLFVASVAASCRVDEYASFLAASGPACRHSWTRCPGKPHEGSGRYAFLPDTLVPRVCINRAQMLYHGYGWDHASLDCKGFGKHGLRALYRIGYTPGHHTFVVCVVPAISLSFAFGINADVASVCERSTRSIIPFLSELVSAHVTHIAALENSSMKKATLFNPVLNSQLCEAPAPGRAYSEHVRYCASKSPYVVERDANIEPYCGESFLSLTDMRFSVAALERGSAPADPEKYRSPVTLSIRYQEVELPGRNGKQGLYLVTENFAFGDSLTYAVVYDAAAYRSPAAAARAFEAHKHGYALDRRECGMYRVMHPMHGLLSDHLELSTVELSAQDASAKNKAITAKVVCFRGRIYVRGGTYELVRKSVVPTIDDRVAYNLAGAQPAVAEPRSPGDESDVSAAPSNMFSQVLAAQAGIEKVQDIGPRAGGGAAVGGGFRAGFRAGAGAGFRAGAGVGFRGAPVGGWRRAPGWRGGWGGWGWRGGYWGGYYRPWLWPAWPGYYSGCWRPSPYGPVYMCGPNAFPVAAYGGVGVGVGVGPVSIGVGAGPVVY